jgi:hypothetical protein
MPPKSDLKIVASDAATSRALDEFAERLPDDDFTDRYSKKELVAFEKIIREYGVTLEDAIHFYSWWHRRKAAP